MAGLAVSRANSPSLIVTPAKLSVNGAEVATMAISDDYSGAVAPGQVVLSVATSSGGRYSYRFKADAGFSAAHSLRSGLRVTLADAGA